MNVRDINQETGEMRERWKERYCREIYVEEIGDEQL